MGLAKNERGTYISYGVPGSSDIEGLMAPDGVMLCVEIKTGKATQNRSQIAFEKMITTMGGVYKVVRNEADLDELCRFIVLRNAGLQDPFSSL